MGTVRGVAAFADACPHRRARLSAGSVTGGALQCIYHGWRFGSDGRCVDIPALGDDAQFPARASLARPAEVTERDGLVWIAPRAPRAPLPELVPGVPLKGEDVATVRLPVLRVEANAAMLIDNFLDEAHLPFVHAATIGGAGVETIPRAEVVRDGLSFTAVREHTFTNLTDPAVVDGWAGGAAEADDVSVPGAVDGYVAAGIPGRWGVAVPDVRGDAGG